MLKAATHRAEKELPKPLMDPGPSGAPQ
jgi:hypothetical protein